ncbi:MAG: hypothetical protein KC550_02215 [Nanoarchaeota archaeon]|nr:hypothetical protein [Nanoarchaeota archaeon]
MVLEIKKDLINEFKRIIEVSFEDYLHYSFLTGSVNYKYYNELINQSDVDLMIILSDKILESHDLIERRKKFNSLYFKLHENYSLKPDKVFPGEIICESMLEEVKFGRGFEKPSDKLFYKKMGGSDEEWLKNHSLEYKCWRSMYFFTKNSSFISGNYDKFILDRNEVILPFIFYLLDYPNSSLPDNLSALEKRLATRIKNSSKSDFGYCKSYESNLFCQEGKIQEIPIQEILQNSGILINGSQEINKPILEEKINTFLNTLNDKKFKYEFNPFII